MARKIIPYPCDYKVTASVKRARRAGNVFVIILCVLIALLLGAAVYFATANDYQALRALDQIGMEYSLIRVVPVDQLPQTDPQTPAVTAPESAATPDPTEDAPAATEAPVVTETPEPQKAEPDTPEPQKEEPETTERPTETEAPSATPVASPDPTYEERMAQPNTENTFDGLPDIVEAVSPGVVGIINFKYAAGTLKLQIAGTGSGFVLTSDGFIVTNQHVVEGANAIRVSFADGTTTDATLVGSDVQSDVAVLKADSETFTALPLGDSDAIRVGEFVLAIGNPISNDELYGSVTFGIISAKARQINIDGFVNEYIQTDAAVNPGNSGGPLINMNGEVIGVTSAKYITAGYDDLGNSISSEGIGFALPIKNVMGIVDSIIKNGSVPRPGIGVTIATRSEEQAALENKPAGVYVYSLTEGGPAQQAGLMVDDVIVALDGVEMTQDEFVNTIRSKTIGDQIAFTVVRNGETLEIVVTVGDLNQMH